MSFSIAWIIEILLLGLSVTFTAYVMPFSRIRNFWTGLLVGLLIALINGLTLWTLNQMGVAINPGSLTLAGVLINMLAILSVDTLVRGFYIRHLFGVSVFALVITLARIGIVEVLGSFS